MKTHGFSLIELMVVVAIVALLAAVAMPSYNSYIKKTKLAVSEPVRKDFINRIIQYYETNGRMPTIVSDIGFVGSTSHTPDNFPISLNEYALPPYLIYQVFGGSGGSPGNCATVSVSQFVSNFDSTGAYTAVNLTANHVIFSTIMVETGNGVWKTLCQISDSTDNTGSVASNINGECYNGMNSAGQDAFTSRYYALIATCP